MNNDSFLVWNSASVTDVGKVRAINQDAYLDLPELGLWVVADGMGGHQAGEVASRMIVEHLEQMNEPHDLNSFAAEAKTRLQEVNRNLRQLANQQFEHGTIGSTVVALLAYGKQCAYIWVGDSRIYRLRNQQLEQMTKDHSVAEEYIEQGLMTEEEAYNSNIANALTRAVGAEDDLEIDLLFDEIQNGDRFLLCSDGLYREINLEDITDLMGHEDDCFTVTNSLLKSALDNGANDNVSVSVVHIKEAYL